MAAGEAPRWVYLVSSIAVVIYVNLDCLDGKQARRTRSSSPLGQLFDHGCDALSVHLLLANIQASLSHPCNATAGFMLLMVRCAGVRARGQPRGAEHMGEGSC